MTIVELSFFVEVFVNIFFAREFFLIEDDQDLYNFEPVICIYLCPN